MEFEEGVRVIIKKLKGEKLIKGRIKLWYGYSSSNFISYGENFQNGIWMGTDNFILDKSYYREQRLKKLLDE